MYMQRCSHSSHMREIARKHLLIDIGKAIQDWGELEKTILVHCWRKGCRVTRQPGKQYGGS